MRKITYIIWLGSFGFKCTSKENFWGQFYDANKESRFDFNAGFRNADDVAKYVFKYFQEVDEIHYVHNDGISDDNKPIKIYKK